MGTNKVTLPFIQCPIIVLNYIFIYRFLRARLRCAHWYDLLRPAQAAIRNRSKLAVLSCLVRSLEAVPTHTLHRKIERRSSTDRRVVQLGHHINRQRSGYRGLPVAPQTRWQRRAHPYCARTRLLAGGRR